MSDSMDPRLRALADEIAGADKPVPSAAFRAGLRYSLMTATIEQRPARFAWLRGPLTRTVAAALAVVLVLSAASGSAAASSLPGDPAFVLKRAAEELSLAFTPDASRRLELLVTHTERRLNELATVAKSRPGNADAAVAEYRKAVAQLDRAVASVIVLPASPRREDALTQATTSSTAHLELLQELELRLPEAAQPGLQRAIEAQESVRGRSEEAPGRAAPAGGPPTAPGGAPSNRPAPQSAQPNGPARR